VIDRKMGTKLFIGLVPGIFMAVGLGVMGLGLRAKFL
jgi:hypothetical protein